MNRCRAFSVGTSLVACAFVVATLLSRPQHPVRFSPPSPSIWTKAEPANLSPYIAKLSNLPPKAIGAVIRSTFRGSVIGCGKPNAGTGTRLLRLRLNSEVEQHGSFVVDVVIDTRGIDGRYGERGWAGLGHPAAPGLDLGKVFLEVIFKSPGHQACPEHHAPGDWQRFLEPRNGSCRLSERDRDDGLYCCGFGDVNRARMLRSQTWFAFEGRSVERMFLAQVAVRVNLKDSLPGRAAALHAAFSRVGRMVRHCGQPNGGQRFMTLARACAVPVDEGGGAPPQFGRKDVEVLRKFSRIGEEWSTLLMQHQEPPPSQCCAELGLRKSACPTDRAVCPSFVDEPTCRWPLVPGVATDGIDRGCEVWIRRNACPFQRLFLAAERAGANAHPEHLFILSQEQPPYDEGLCGTGFVGADLTKSFPFGINELAREEHRAVWLPSSPRHPCLTFNLTQKAVEAFDAAVVGEERGVELSNGAIAPPTIRNYKFLAMSPESERRRIPRCVGRTSAGAPQEAGGDAVACCREVRVGGLLGSSITKCESQCNAHPLCIGFTFVAYAIGGKRCRLTTSACFYGSSGKDPPDSTFASDSEITPEAVNSLLVPCCSGAGRSKGRQRGDSSKRGARRKEPPVFECCGGSETIAVAVLES